MKRVPRNNLAALFVLTPAMLDCFAIPLLVIASRQQQHYEEAPLVARETPGAAARRMENPRIVELGRGDPILDGEPVAWGALAGSFTADTDARQILVRVRTSAEGQGPVSDLLRLSLIAREHRFADRVLFISRQPKSSPAAKGDRS